MSVAVYELLITLTCIKFCVHSHWLHEYVYSVSISNLANTSSYIYENTFIKFPQHNNALMEVINSG